MPEGDILRRTAAELAVLTDGVLVRSELRWPSAAGVTFVGRRVLGTHAYGKHLFTRFDDGRSLHTHLRMEGSWRVVPSPAPRARADSPYVRAVLATEQWTAIGNRLGMLDVVRTTAEHTLIGHLGPDLLAEDFPAQLPEAVRRFRADPARPVAEVLLDQTVVAGIGTIYAAESLFTRRLWPWTPAGEVAAEPLLTTARRLMLRSVAAPRPTATGDALGTMVHGRSGRPCRRCGTTVRVVEVREPPMQRPLYFCPSCQRAAAGSSADGGELVP